MNERIGNVSQANQADMIETIQEDAMIEEGVLLDAKEMLARGDEANTAKGMAVKTKPLKPENKTKTKLVQRVEKGIFTRKDTDNLANDFASRDDNRDYLLPPSALSLLALGLGEIITPDTSYEDLVNLVRTELTEGGKKPDVSQVDRVFGFLLEVAQSKMETAEGLRATYLENLFDNIKIIKLQHYETFKADIETAHNIVGAAATLVDANRSTAEMIEHIRHMVNEPQDVHTKYKYYKEKSYTYQQMSDEFKLLFNYMGNKVKEKLENPHLRQLLEEIKVLQSILVVYNESHKQLKSSYTHLNRVVGIFNE